MRTVQLFEKDRQTLFDHQQGDLPLGIGFVSRQPPQGLKAVRRMFPRRLGAQMRADRRMLEQGRHAAACSAWATILRIRGMASSRTRALSSTRSPRSAWVI